MPLPQFTIAGGAPKPAQAGNRADVVLFAGLIARRDAPLPDAQSQWLDRSPYAAADRASLLDTPVPIDSFVEFASVFAWDTRPVEAGSAEQIPARLGMAVKHFFDQGGARCFVLRVGDPLPLLGEDGESAGDGRKRFAALLDWRRGQANAPADADDRVPLLPGIAGKAAMPDPQSPESWQGAGHMLGLEEAVMLCLPDLPDLIAGPSHRLPETRTPAAGEEKFVDCAPAISTTEPEERLLRPDYAAPRLTLAGYRDWALALRHTLDMLDGRNSAAHRRDCMVIAALPLPDPTDDALPPDVMEWPLALDTVDLPGQGDTDLPPIFASEMAGSGRVQLAWPWLRMADSTTQPEGASGGDGALAGAIARSTLSLGLHRSAAGALRVPPRATLPDVPGHILRRSVAGGPYGWLGDLCCLFALRNGEIRLLSDVTAARDDGWREGGSARIMGALIRQARLLGQELAFAPNGEASWATARRTLAALLEEFRMGGALAGSGPGSAYSVRCDRETMRAQDVDQGRLIAEVSFRPARTLQHIYLALDLRGRAA